MIRRYVSLMLGFAVALGVVVTHDAEALPKRDMVNAIERSSGTSAPWPVADVRLDKSRVELGQLDVAQPATELIRLQAFTFDSAVAPRVLLGVRVTPDSVMQVEWGVVLNGGGGVDHGTGVAAVRSQLRTRSVNYEGFVYGWNDSTGQAFTSRQFSRSA